MKPDTFTLDGIPRGFAGVHFPDLFAADNFRWRRTTGHNAHNPESLRFGYELGYGVSRRAWPMDRMVDVTSSAGHTAQFPAAYIDAVSNRLSCENIARIAPCVPYRAPRAPMIPLPAYAAGHAPIVSLADIEAFRSARMTVKEAL